MRDSTPIGKTGLTHFDESIKVLGIDASTTLGDRISDWGLGTG